jgi:hypothetical protein
VGEAHRLRVVQTALAVAFVITAIAMTVWIGLSGESTALPVGTIVLSLLAFALVIVSLVLARRLGTGDPVFSEQLTLRRSLEVVGPIGGAIAGAVFVLFGGLTLRVIFPSITLGAGALAVGAAVGTFAWILSTILRMR